MPGELDALPRTEVGKNFLAGRFEFGLDGFNLAGEVNFLFSRLLPERLDRLLQVHNGFLEFECVESHGLIVNADRRANG